MFTTVAHSQFQLMNGDFSARCDAMASTIVLFDESLQQLLL